MLRPAIKLFIYFVLCFSYPLYAHGQGPQYVSNEILVKIRSSDGVSKNDAEYRFLGKARAQKGLALKAQWRGMGLFHFSMKAGQNMQQTLQELRNDPSVEYAEPNYIYSKNIDGEDVNDIHVYSAAEVGALSGSDSYTATEVPIHAVAAWSAVSDNGERPIVAVIDTGVDITHQVFEESDAIWTNTGEIAGNGVDDDHNGYVDDVHGWNFVAHSPAMYDDDGHGTHVAGIVLGTTQDIDVTPMSQSKIRIMPLKFLDEDGSGTTSDAIEAIYYAISNGAKVMNNSWGGPTYSAALHEAISYAYDHGVTFVAAAGNASENNDSTPMYPASYNVPNIISVAATTPQDGLAYFSNFGRSSVHMGSPGYKILSTYPNGMYATMSGTSMAAPFVSGVAALIKHEQPSILGYQTKELILESTDGVSSLTSRTATGGRLNLLKSVLDAQGASVEDSQPAYSFLNGDRDLASNLAAGGCGMVTKLYHDGRGGGSGGNGFGSGTGMETWYILVVLALLSAPVVVWNLLKTRYPESRRKHERFKINTEVKVSVGGREMIGSISTISLGGVQLNTNAMLEQGGIVRMSILSPDGEEHIDVEGRVVWSEAQKAYGVQFQEARETVLQRISNWTQALTKA